MDPAVATTQAVHDTEDYLNFDPRMGRTRGLGTATAGKTKATFNDALVFVVGGGGYVEYSDLLDLTVRTNAAQAGNAASYAAGPGKRRITYGSTEVLKPKEFLKALGNLR